jgi:hypothetical protein
MKRPVTFLLMAPDHSDNIISGQKKITIRNGERDYRVGDTLALGCHLLNWCVLADITEVRYCPLEEITEEEARDDGFSSPEEMLEGMRNYYPDINYQSRVTVVRWNNLRGKLIDEN